MNALEIAPGLKLPLETVTQAIGILAKRRAGKSYTARRLAEQLLGCGQQVVIVDPKGDQWGIRSSADGKLPGYPVVIVGGERGDVKLEPGSGEIIAKLVVEERVSVLLDLSLLRKHEVATFMTGFLENLYRLKAREEYRTPVMLLIDEADAIAPQKPQKGEERMLGAAEDIVRRGGQRGIGCTLVTQRSAVLNKNVLTQVQVLIVLRTIAPQDLAALDAWIDVHGTEQQRKTLRESLPSLPVGDAWFWSPGWPDTDGIFKRVHVLPIETFDSGATPKVGEKRVEPRNLADVDLEALQRQMAETIERAKADDPKELKRQLAERDKKIAQLQKAAPIAVAAPTADPERFKKEFERGARSVKAELGRQLRVHLKAQAARTQTVVDALQEVRTTLSAAIEMVLAIEMPPAPGLDQIIADAGKFSPPPAPMARAAAATVSAPRVPAPPRKPVASTNGDGPMRLQKAERQILKVLAQFGETGRNKLALIAGYSSGGGGFGNALSSLRTSSFITGSDPLFITDAGLDALGEYDPLPTGSDLLAYWKRREGKAERSILECLAKHHSIDRSSLAELAGYAEAGGGFGNALSRLRTLGLISGSREIKIAEELLG